MLKYSEDSYLTTFSADALCSSFRDSAFESCLYRADGLYCVACIYYLATPTISSLRCSTSLRCSISNAGSTYPMSRHIVLFPPVVYRAITRVFYSCKSCDRRFYVTWPWKQWSQGPGHVKLWYATAS